MDTEEQREGLSSSLEMEIRVDPWVACGSVCNQQLISVDLKERTVMLVSIP